MRTGLISRSEQLCTSLHKSKLFTVETYQEPGSPVRLVFETDTSVEEGSKSCRSNVQTILTYQPNVADRARQPGAFAAIAEIKSKARPARPARRHCIDAPVKGCETYSTETEVCPVCRSGDVLLAWHDTETEQSTPQQPAALSPYRTERGRAITWLPIEMKDLGRTRLCSS